MTHPRIYFSPTPLGKAIEQIEAWMESPSLVLLSETEDYWMHLRPILVTGRVSGPKIHDARVAALCKEHGLTELWAADRDFGHFPDIQVRNPLVG